MAILYQASLTGFATPSALAFYPGSTATGRTSMTSICARRG
ncbi:MAG: hypothetical protein R3F43_05765 [bacterium]